ncbi:MAG: transcription antitermination factor NusB [Alphaproteobacteria bacterium]
MTEHTNEPLGEQFNATATTDDPRTEARLCAIQAVYQCRLIGEDVRHVQETFLKGPVASRKANKALFAALLTATMLEQPRFAQLIANHLKDGWTVERLDTTMQALLLTAVAELSTQAEAEPKVVLGEYVALARAFFDDKQAGFVNGILDKIARVVRPEVFVS